MSTDRTIQLSNLGAKLLARLTFTDEWNADLSQSLSDILETNGFDIENIAEIRSICTNHGINTSDYGDTAPSVTFGHTGVITNEAENEKVRLQIAAWHDAKRRGDQYGDEMAVDAAEDVITALCSFAGVRIK